MNCSFKISWEVVFALVVIGVLSFMPGNTDVMKIKTFNIPHFDKIVHFVMYAMLGMSLLRAFYAANKFLKRYMFFSVVIATIVGVLCEIIQHYCIEMRSGDVMDALANSAGALFGVFIIRNRKNKRVQFVE